MKLNIFDKNTKADNTIDKSNNTPEHLLKRSNVLSWDERQLIEYVRNHPEERNHIIELLKK